MHIRYVRETRTTPVRRNKTITQDVIVGVMICEKQDGELFFGCSYLNPADYDALVHHNRRVQRDIARLKREQRLGKQQPEGVEILPLFDKQTALTTAQARLTKAQDLDLNQVPRSIRQRFNNFCRHCIASFHIKKEGYFKSSK